MGAWDLVTVGGGLAGAGLARLMAERGARVLVLERTTGFRDRVRGEVLVPWGVADAKRLGFDELLRPVGNDLVRWEIFGADHQMMFTRDIPSTCLPGVAVLTYYHPEMQDLVLESARAAGAEIRRGARVTGLEPARGAQGPAVTFVADGREERAAARLVVGADGRGSSVRGWVGFETRREPERRLFAGVLFENMLAPEDVLHQGFLFGTGLMTYAFPLGKGRVRCYVGYQKDTGVERFQGEKDIARFVETAIRVGVPAEWYAPAKPAGPLATFDATHEWVDFPHRDGIVLVGDAAATSDPTWGQGMSVVLRDLRLLRERLLETDDWDAAGRAYAADHDDFHEQVRVADSWYTDLFLDVGPHADALRGRALPQLLQDPTRLLDTPLSGPEIAATDDARRRFHGEDAGEVSA